MKSPEERQRIQKLAKENRIRNKLENNAAHQKQMENQKRSNERKRKKLADMKALGIKPVNKPLSEKQKAYMREYARNKRKEAAALRVKKVPMTPEQLRIRKAENSRRHYDIKLDRLGKKRQPVKKMEKILKARPERRISEKVIKPVKMDHAKQPDVVVIKSSEDGKVKVRLNDKTWVYAKPGYVLEDLKRKFGIA